MRNDEKRQKIIIISIVIAAIIIITLSAKFIDRKSDSNSKSDEIQDLESVSTQIGKSTEEAEKETTNKIEFETADLINNETSNNSTDSNNSTNAKDNNTIIENTSKKEKLDNSVNSSVIKETPKITFISPISGPVLREFSGDSLVYSDTLKEWIIHKGIDIKADKTSVVKAAADGKVFAIKNDPRYGLTVIINHDNGYQTIYSNLLTSEFVVEGEEIKAGQSIGTVGNTASFEILDDYHLHFELLQNNKHLDPSIFINFD